MTAVEDGQGQEVQQREVDVDHHHEGECPPEIDPHLGRQSRKDPHRSLQVLHAHTGFLLVEEGCEQVSHLGNSVADLTERRGAGFFDGVGHPCGKPKQHADPGDLLLRVQHGRDLQAHGLCVPEQFQVDDLVGPSADQFNELLLSRDLDAVDGDDLIAFQNASPLGSRARSDRVNCRMILGPKLEELEVGRLGVLGGDVVGSRPSVGVLDAY